MSTAGQKEVLGAVEIVVGEVINAYTYGTGGDWLIQMGIETMVAGGLQELANLLAPSPLPAAQNGIIRSTVASQQIVYGQVKTGGVVIFSDSYSTNNQFLDVAIAHSLTRSTGSVGLALQGVSGFYVNDVFIPVNTGSGGWNSAGGSITSSGVGQPYDVFAGNLWIYFHDGSQTTVDSELHTNFSYWASTAIGKGVCYSVFKMFNSSDQATFQAAYPQGIPNMLGAVLSGQKVYDPRLDSSNGGSGTQRLGNSATWTFSSNPALIAADYLLRPKSDGGCGFTSSVINWPSVAAAANICDQNVTVPAYGATWSGSAWSATVTQAQYTCNVSLDTATNCDQNLRTILDCMAGVCVIATGQIYLYAGAPTSSSGSFDETFLAGEIQFTNESPRQSRWNCVKATYGQDANCDYQQQEAVPYFNTSYITADGGVTLLKSITLPGVTNQFTAQYLEIIETQRSRNKQVLNVKCNLKMLQYQVYDVVSVTIAEYGLSSAPFRILSLTLNSDLSVSVTMQQEQSGTYTVALSQFQAFTSPNLVLTGLAPGAPDTPTSPLANAVPGGILVQWTPPSPNNYQYIKVYRAPDVSGSPGTFTLKARVVGDSYLDNNGSSAKRYWYQMQAVNRWLQASGTTTPVSAYGVYRGASIGGSQGQNLVENGNFEASTAFDINGAPPGWIVGPGAISAPILVPSAVVYETSTPYDGNQSLHVTCTAQFQGVAQSRSFAVTVGDTYYVTAAMKTGGGTQQAAFVLWFVDKNGNTLTSISASTSVGSTSYNVASASGTVPANAVLGYIVFCNKNNGAADIWLDDATVIRKANLSNTDVATIGSIPPTNPTTSFSYQAFASVGAWPASTNLVIGSCIISSGRLFVVNQSGITGGTIPSFNLAFGATTADNTVIWTCLGSQTNGPGCNITATFSSFTRADGSTVTLPRQIFVIWGQTGGTTVFPYIGYDEILQDVFLYGTDGAATCWKAEYTGGVNSNQSSTCVYTNRNNAINAAALQSAQTVVALSVSGNMSIAIPSSGSSSGSGGGYTHVGTGGYCPHERQMVLTDEGYLPAADLVELPEAKLWTGKAWVKPLRVQADAHERWCRVTVELADGKRITETVTQRHCYIGHDGALVSSEDMGFGTVLRSESGFVEVVGLEWFTEKALAIAIDLPEPHAFYITRGGAESHNTLNKP